MPRDRPDRHLLSAVQPLSPGSPLVNSTHPGGTTGPGPSAGPSPVVPRQEAGGNFRSAICHSSRFASRAAPAPAPRNSPTVPPQNLAAHKWVQRRRADGEAGLHDRSSRPGTTPHRTPAGAEARVCRLRTGRKLGPARIGPILGLPASTVHRILVRHGLNRPAFFDRPTGAVIRRCERARPGELVHVDIKKLGNIPDGGGWRVVGRTAGDRNRQATTGQRKSSTPVIGHSHLHSAVDDPSRLAHSEVLADERQHTAIAFWQRANAFFAAHGITVERTLLDERAYLRPYHSNEERTAALADLLHTYHHHRCHTALDGHPPITRVNNNPAGQYT